MEALLAKLSRTGSTEELSDVLIRVRAALGNITSSPDLKKFESMLVLLCCQNNNLAHCHGEAERRLRWDTLERLYEVLLELCE